MNQKRFYATCFFTSSSLVIIRKTTRTYFDPKGVKRFCCFFVFFMARVFSFTSQNFCRLYCFTWACEQDRAVDLSPHLCPGRGCSLTAPAPFHRLLTGSSWTWRLFRPRSPTRTSPTWPTSRALFATMVASSPPTRWLFDRLHLSLGAVAAFAVSHRWCCSRNCGRHGCRGCKAQLMRSIIDGAAVVAV